jgi:ADP-ribose pyrophosphatase YjhB (NUDIX family)
MRHVTLLFLVDGDKVLLAMKKRGFGVGRWNGVGGKPKEGETIKRTAIRECQEEITVMPVKLIKTAAISFYFPKDKSNWNQTAVVYLCDKWLGEPTETEEMAPKWFSVNELPFDKMWSADKDWLPEVLKGNFVKADIYFDDNDKVIRQKIKTTAKAK